jgi:drug/metabolite transporter (DMT)-like permease
MDLQLGLLLGITAMAFWGVSDFISAVVSKRIGSFMTFFMARIIGVALLAVLLVFFYRSATYSPLTILLIIVAGGINFASTLIYYKGFAIGEASIISPVAASYPVITVLLGVFLLKEQISVLQVAAIILIIIGSISASFRLKDILHYRTKKLAKGIKYGLTASALWGVMVFLIGVLSNTIGWYMPVLLVDAIGLLLAFPAYKIYKMKLSAPPASVLIIVLLCIALSVGNVLGWFAYDLGTTVSYISVVAAVSSVYPIITVLLSRIILKERISANQVAGIFLVLLALVILAF